MSLKHCLFCFKGSSKRLVAYYRLQSDSLERGEDIVEDIVWKGLYRNYEK